MIDIGGAPIATNKNVPNIRRNIFGLILINNELHHQVYLDITSYRNCFITTLPW